MLKKIINTILFGIFAFGSSASAALLTFDLFGQGGDLGHQETFFSGGYSINVEAFWTSNRRDSSFSNADIYQNRNGLGICNHENSEGDCTDSSQQIDDRYREDILRVDLGSLNAPISAILGVVGRNDDWEIRASNSDELPINSATLIASGDGSIADLTSAADLQYLFFVGGNGGGYLDNNDYRLRSLTVHVPEPATLGLLGFGLIALSIGRRRAGKFHKNTGRPQ